MRFRHLLLFSILSASQAALAGPGDDAISLRIDAGRLGVIVDQSEEALRLIAPKSQAFGTEAEEHAYVLEELVTAVRRYNRVSDQACHAGAVAPALCTGPYLPVWLKDAPDAAYTGTQLRTMVDETSNRLVPFWEYLCGKAKKKTHDESFCQIE